MRREEAKDKITYDLLLIKNSLGILKNSWIDDINTDGTRFNIDAQDSYATLYGGILNISDFVLQEKIQIEEISIKRKELWDELKIILNDIVKLYHEHIEFFNSLDRQKLAIQGFRRFTPEIQDYSIDLIEEKFIILVNSFPLETYRKSPIYREYGFLQEDFHFKIYFYVKNFLDQIGNDVLDLTVFKNLEKYKGEELVDMGLIDELYKIGALKVFKEISKYEFYKAFNFLSITNKLIICDGFNKKSYYLISEIYKTVPINFRDEWLPLMLNKLKIKESNYKRTYRKIVSSDASREDVIYADLLHKVFNTIK